MNNIIFEKLWEDTDFYKVGIIAKSEFASVKGEIFVTPQNISSLANGIESFAKNEISYYLWENGKKGTGYTTYISLNFTQKNKCGHSLIEVFFEIDDGGIPEKHNCCFYINSEIGMLLEFSKSLTSLNSGKIGTKIFLKKDI